MKTPRIANAIGHIDDELILGASENKKRNYTSKWMAFAACFAVIVIASAVILPSFLGGKKPNPEQMSSHIEEDIEFLPDELGSRYKDFEIMTDNSAIIWPWEYLTDGERFYETEINGVKYGKSRAVSENLIGTKIGAYDILGYDEITDEQHAKTCEVYQLNNVSQSEFVAVKIADSYYIFKNSEYNPPQTLGNLFERVDLPQFFKLERFSENGDGPDRNHFTLNNDEYIWKVLSDCKGAAFIDQDKQSWHKYDRDFIQFSISSEALGIYKHALSITEDGYLWTNAFDWGYLYDIGKDAAEKIIKYAMENSKETEYEPYSNSNSVCGKITEITDDYILVDDSILCKDSADGVVYKILINDIRISRYLDLNVIKDGETVQIFYEGEIDEQNLNTISSAYSISDVDILFEDENDEKENSSRTESKTVSSRYK